MVTQIYGRGLHGSTQSTISLDGTGRQLSWPCTARDGKGEAEGDRRGGRGYKL